jgi:hypothetical protein
MGSAAFTNLLRERFLYAWGQVLWALPSFAGPAPSNDLEGYNGL